MIAIKFNFSCMSAQIPTQCGWDSGSFLSPDRRVDQKYSSQEKKRLYIEIERAMGNQIVMRAEDFFQYILISALIWTALQVRETMWRDPFSYALGVLALTRGCTTETIDQNTFSSDCSSWTQTTGISTKRVVFLLIYSISLHAVRNSLVSPVLLNLWWAYLTLLLAISNSPSLGRGTSGCSPGSRTRLVAGHLCALPTRSTQIVLVFQELRYPLLTILTKLVGTERDSTVAQIL